MTDFTDAYENLLIKQYWEKSKARAEIRMQAESWEKIKNLLSSFVYEFDVDTATGDRLDIIGKIVGIGRTVRSIIPKIYFGFSDNTTSTGFDDKFDAVIGTKPFADKTQSAYSDLELTDPDYRYFIKAKISVNNGSGYMVSDTKLSIQQVVNSLFDGQAYVVDTQDMGLVLYVSPLYDLTRLRALIQLKLLPKPQAVAYKLVVNSFIGESFGFDDNPLALGFGDLFDPLIIGGKLAEGVII